MGHERVVRQAGAREARLYEREDAEHVSGFMQVIGRVMPVDMARHLLGRLVLGRMFRCAAD